MPKHVTIAALSAQEQKKLSPAQELWMRAHLSECPDCAQRAEIFAALARMPVLRSARATPAATVCLEPEILANYLNGKYFFWRRWQIQKHLAACAECRGTIADLIRMHQTQLSAEETAWLKTLPNFQPQAVPALQPRRAPTWSAEVWAEIKYFVYARPRLARGLAFAAMVFLAVKIGWPEISNWQSHRLARQGFDELAQQYEISTNELRPAGKFQPKILSRLRSPQEASASINPMEEFQSSLRWKADNLSAQRGQALAAYFTGEKETAARTLQTLQQQNPNDAEILNDLGVVTAALNSPDQALEYFSRALALQPNFPAASFNRAFLLQQLDRPAEARHAWLAYLQLNEKTAWHDFAKLQNAQLE